MHCDPRRFRACSSRRVVRHRHMAAPARAFAGNVRRVSYGEFRLLLLRKPVQIVSKCIRRRHFFRLLLFNNESRAMPPSSSSVSAALPQAPRENKEKNIVRLTQRDFAQGTYISTQPDTVLILSENITVSFPPIEKHNQKPLTFGLVCGHRLRGASSDTQTQWQDAAHAPNFRERQRFLA